MAQLEPSFTLRRKRGAWGGQEEPTIWHSGHCDSGKDVVDSGKIIMEL